MNFINYIRIRKMKKKHINNNNNKIFIWNKQNNYNEEELNKVMPPNIINYK